MMKPNERALSRYFRSIGSWLPCSRKQRQSILAAVEENVRGYIAENPEATLSQIKKQFGSPRQIAAGYVDDMDTAALLSALRLRKRIYKAIIAFLLAVLLLWGIGVGIAVIEQHNATNGWFQQEVRS